LEAKWEPPADLTSEVIKSAECLRYHLGVYPLISYWVVWQICEAKVHPIGENKAEDEEGELDSDQLASQRGFAGLALPHWYRSRVHTDTQASDNTSNDHMWQSVGCSLKDAAHRQERTAKGYRSSSTQHVANDQTEQGTEDATDRVGRHDLTLKCRAWVIEGAEEVWVRKKSTEDALIVSCIASQYIHQDRSIDR
jgi:hypothetical protein